MRLGIYALAGRVTLGALLAGVLAGCGGGSNGAPGQSAQTASLSGTVLDNNGKALSDYLVIYDLNIVTGASSSISATTDAQGNYTITVPAQDITGQDTLSFEDSLGSLAATVVVLPVAGVTSAPLTTVIALNPPPVAPLSVKK